MSLLRPLRRRLAIASCIFLLLFVPGGCILERPQGIDIENDLGDTVDVVYLKDVEIDGGSLQPGVTRVFPFDLYRPGVPDKESCTTADIVARTSTGIVVAVVPPPRCIGSSVRLSEWASH